MVAVTRKSSRRKVDLKNPNAAKCDEKIQGDFASVCGRIAPHSHAFKHGFNDPYINELSKLIALI